MLERNPIQRGLAARLLPGDEVIDVAYRDWQRFSSTWRTRGAGRNKQEDRGWRLQRCRSELLFIDGYPLNVLLLIVDEGPESP